MTIYDYIDEYSIYTFEEKPFNEVDATIFSFLSYVDYGKIVEEEKIEMKNVGRMHFGIHNKKEKNIKAVKDGTAILNYIKDTIRYKNCKLFHYVYDLDNDIQFSAISIEYQKDKVYISFEGTDDKISGWKENFVLAYEFPSLSHKKAISYLNKYFTFTNKKLIVGGHSKGGNLALVASMEANFLVKHHIEKVYNMDGPGLLKKEFESKRFKKILPKYTHIIPDNSMIGIILYSDHKKIIKSSIVGPLAHDILYWNVINNELEPAKLSSFSKELEKSIIKYVESHETEEIKSAVENLYYICKKANITTLLELKDSKKIMAFINECKDLNVSSRNMVYEFTSIILKAFGYSKYVDFLNFMKKQNKKIRVQEKV